MQYIRERLPYIMLFLILLAALTLSLVPVLRSQPTGEVAPGDPSPMLDAVLQAVGGYLNNPALLAALILGAVINYLFRYYYAKHVQVDILTYFLQRESIHYTIASLVASATGLPLLGALFKVPLGELSTGSIVLAILCGLLGDRINRVRGVLTGQVPITGTAKS